LCLDGREPPPEHGDGSLLQQRAVCKVALRKKERLVMTLRRRPPHVKDSPDHESETDPAATSGEQRLLTQRAALILTAALLIGAAAGILTYLAGTCPAGAVLTGGTAFGAAIALLNTLIA
jgi:hypothetical protein